MFCLILLQGAGYGKVVSQVIIGLKTVKGAKQLKLDPTIYDSLQKEKVQVRHVFHVPDMCFFAFGREKRQW